MAREGGLRNQHQWLTAKEAAALLGVQTRTIYAYASRGLLGATARGPDKSARYLRELVETLRQKAAARAGHAAVAAGALRWGEPVLDSAITRLTPRGPVYRGQRAIDLVETPYEQVAELLWASGPANWKTRLSRLAVHAHRPSLHALLEVVVAHAPSLRETPWTSATALMRRLACAVGPAEVQAEREKSFAASIATSLRGKRPDARTERLINASLVLMADHELNPSTFAARVAASARAPWVDCVISAMGACAGVRHASACDEAEAMWRRAPRSGAMTGFVRAELAHGPLPGFDAGAYPQGDPRAQRLLELLLPTLPANERVRIETFLAAVDAETGQLPAIDFALTVTSDALGLPRGSPTMLFVLGRTAGWLAHIVEQHQSEDFIRPRARWSGASATPAVAPPPRRAR